MFWNQWYVVIYGDQCRVPSMDEVTFTCSLCHKQYLGTTPVVPNFTPEQVASLRLAWLKSEDKLSGAPDNEHFERDAQKAWFAYMATKSDMVFRVPPGLTTIRKSDKYLLLCTDHEEVKQKEKSESKAAKSCGDGHDCGGHREETNIQG